MSVLALLKLFGGLTYLLIAGDLLVRGALALARQARISPMIVGLTVVAFGTSAPELMISVSAALQGVPGIAIGNVVGSNIANVLLVLGLPALIYAMRCNQPLARRDGSMMLGISVLFAAMCAMGALGKPQGVVMLIVLSVYLVMVLRAGQLEVDELDTQVDRVLGLPSHKLTIALFFVLGVGGLQLGAKLTIEGVMAVAEQAGVPETVVALTAVALGTSLPELATTMMAAFQRQSDVALGNVIGSNVFNVVAIMAAAIFASSAPISVPTAILHFDLPVMLAAALALTAFTWTGRAIGLRAGIVFLIAYGVYIAVLLQTRSV